MMNPNMINNMNMGMNQNPMMNPMMNNPMMNPMMNQMNQNQMKMNPMNMQNNQMGMDNYSMGNLFNDINALKIKNLITPYEEKIKELEDKLRQKEFEIACLKNKLNEKNEIGGENIMMNQMMMNQMNPMNMMANQMMVSQNDDDKLIDIFFLQKGNLKQRIRCSFDELIISIINKYCRKNGIDKDDYKFIFNGKKLNDYLTVAESGINNSSTINVIKTKNYSKHINSNENENIKSNEFMNIRFSFSSGLNVIIVCNYDETVEDALKKLCKRVNKNYDKSLFNKYLFLYNYDKIKFDNLSVKIRTFFYNTNPQILVHETNNLIGN